MVVASLLYAVCLYRAYGALDPLSPYIYIYYELLLVMYSNNYLLYYNMLYCNGSFIHGMIFL